MPETKNEGTPGPWVMQTPVTGRGHEAGLAVIASDEEFRISNPSRGIVAFVSRRPGMTNAETLANARLIAAAPETKRQRDALLKALRALRYRYVGLVESGDCGCWNPNEEEDVTAANDILAECDATDVP